jgi:hypothetical protein
LVDSGHLNQIGVLKMATREELNELIDFNFPGTLADWGTLPFDAVKLFPAAAALDVYFVCLAELAGRLFATLRKQLPESLSPTELENLLAFCKENPFIDIKEALVLIKSSGLKRKLTR